MIWHPVDERKPVKAGRYLVADMMVDEPYVAAYTKRRGFLDEDDVTLNPWVTHWMELPKHPSSGSSAHHFQEGSK